MVCVITIIVTSICYSLWMTVIGID